MRFLRLAGIVCLVTVFSVGGQRLRPGSPAPPALARSAPPVSAVSRLPLRFEPNRGQAARQALYIAHASGYTLFLTSTDAVMVLPMARPGALHPWGSVGTIATIPSIDGYLAQKNPFPVAAIRLHPIGVSRVPVVPMGRPRGISNYFIGNDPRRWHTRIPLYGSVEERNIYPGISLRYRGTSSQLEYDWLLRPGASPDTIRMAITSMAPQRVGAATQVDASGRLLIHLGQVTIREALPAAYQTIEGTRRSVQARFVLRHNTIGFALGSFDRQLPLVIDPTVSYIDLIGGSGSDIGVDAGIDGNGDGYIAGATASVNFPTATPQQGSFAGGSFDVALVKLDPSGKFLWSTYLGGSGLDYGNGIAVDDSGNAFITGDTRSGNFPTHNALQSRSAGGQDAFVAEVSSDGTTLDYSTYLGGSRDDSGVRIALDPQDNAYVTGSTQSPDFPTRNPAQPSYSGPGNTCATSQGNPIPCSDAFVAKIDPSGKTLLYSTYLGGSQDQAGFAIATDQAGNAYVGGFTTSSNFPTVQPVQASYGGNEDAFVARFSPQGNLDFSTYRGGSGFDIASGIGVADGETFVAIDSTSPSFPSPASPARSLRPHQVGARERWALEVLFNDKEVALEDDEPSLPPSFQSVDQDVGKLAVLPIGNSVYIDSLVDFNGVPDSIGLFSQQFLPKTGTFGQHWFEPFAGMNDVIGSGLAADSAGRIFIDGATNSPSIMGSSITAPITKMGPLGGQYDMFGLLITDIPPVISPFFQNARPSQVTIPGIGTVDALTYTLTYTPGFESTPCDEIYIIQVLKRTATVNGAVRFLHPDDSPTIGPPEDAKEMRKSETPAGAVVDHIPGEKSLTPYYNAPINSTYYGSPPNYAVNAYGDVGSRDGTSKNASLNDTPSAPVLPPGMTELTDHFEDAVYCAKGEDAGKYFAWFKWEYHSTETEDSINPVSSGFGDPSPEFKDAVATFNQNLGKSLATPRRSPHAARPSLRIVLTPRAHTLARLSRSLSPLAGSSFGPFKHMSAGQLGHLQVKLSFVGTQVKPFPSLGFSSKIGSFQLSQFAPYHLVYPSDQLGVMGGCSPSTVALHALLQRIGKNRALASGKNDTNPILNVTLVNQVGKTTREFTESLGAARATQLYAQLRAGACSAPANLQEKIFGLS